MTKSKLLVFSGRAGAGKTTLIKKLHSRHTAYAVRDVYPVVKKYAWIGRGRFDLKKTRLGYRAFYKSLHPITKNTIIEVGINHADINLNELAKLNKGVDIHIFIVLRDIKQCFSFKKKQRGVNFDSRQLRQRLRWPFPSIHERLAKKHVIPTHRLYMSRGYPAAIKTIERIIS